METLLHDLRYGVRMLVKSPFFTVVTVIALALGIGANTAIFSVVNGILLRPLPFKDADRIVRVLVTTQQTVSNTHSPANYLDIKSQNRTFENLVAHCEYPVSLTSVKEPRSLAGQIVTSEFFDMLGIDPQLGRVFRAEDGKPGGPRLAVLSNKIWREIFDGDQNIAGKEAVFNNESFTITGVMPAGFDFPENTQVWLLARKQVPEPPFTLTPEYENQRTLVYLTITGKLKSGISIEQAQSDLTTVMDGLRRQYPKEIEKSGLLIQPLKKYLVRDVSQSLFVLLGAVAAVLLIAIANVANLSLARAAARQQEIAIRVALGASRFRIMRQLLTESLLLSILGGACGLLLAVWGTRVLVSMAPVDIPRLKEIGMDGQVLVFTIFVSLLTGLIFGISPSIQASKPNLNESLKDGARSSAGSGRGYRAILVVAEIALSMVLLIGAGLLIKSFIRLQEVNPGFDSTNLMAAETTLPIVKYTQDQQMITYISGVVRGIRGIPGVKNVGTTTGLPYTNSEIHMSFMVVGQPRREGEPDLRFDAVSPDFFLAMGIPLIKGRFFSEQDQLNSPKVGIINHAMVDRYFHDVDPIGQKLDLSDGKGAREIVGVVGDVKYDGLNAEAKPQVYVPSLQCPWPFVAIVIKTSVPPLGLGPEVRRRIWAVDKEEPIDELKVLGKYQYDSVSQPRFRTVLLGSFAGLALLLAAVGIFGVMAYTVSQSTREIGIRMALGAQKQDVLRLVLGQGMALTAVGILIGLFAAYLLTRFLAALLFSVSATDPVTFVLIPVLLATVALLACYLPARRAARVDPLIAIRHE